MLFLIIFLLELVFLFSLSHFLTKSLSRLFYQLIRSQTLTINLISILFLPGIILHELAHMFAAAILMVPVGEIEFMPKVISQADGGGVKMGSVTIGKTDPFRRAIIGFAPVFAGVAVIIGSLYYFFNANDFFSVPIKLVLAFYILFAVGNTMFSSKKDLEGTLELILAFLIIGLGLYFAGVRIPENWLEFVFSALNQKLLQTACFMMLAPIGVDLVIIGATKIRLRK